MDDHNKEIPHDDMFTVSYSDSMEIRNILRTKLVHAQGRETDKIPLFVSWPGWLEDGIVCLYVRDLREILRNAVRETAHAMLGALDQQSGEPAGGGTQHGPSTDTAANAPAGIDPSAGTSQPSGTEPAAAAPSDSAGKTGSGDSPQTPPAAGKQPSSAPGSPPAESGEGGTRKKPRISTAPPASKERTLGSMLEPDDIEDLIREEMNRKKR